MALLYGRAGRLTAPFRLAAWLGQITQGATQLIVRISCGGGTEALDSQGGDFVVAATQNQATTAGTAGQIWATVNVTVPSTSTGEVHVPVRSPSAGTIAEAGVVVWRDGKAVPGAIGVKLRGSDGRFVIFDIAAGNYSFSSAL